LRYGQRPLELAACKTSEWAQGRSAISARRRSFRHAVNSKLRLTIARHVATRMWEQQRHPARTRSTDEL